MRRSLGAFVVGALITGTCVAPASAEQSCSTHMAVCESACTPAHVARYHFGNIDRCETSCEPRRQQCLRTGIWVDLERRSTGWWESAVPF